MRRLGLWLFGVAGRLVVRLLMTTVRFRLEGADRLGEHEEAGQPVILCLWHGRLLPLAYYHRRRGIAAMISQSKDGEYIARVVDGWGYVPVRGSTSRGGGNALRGLVEQARSGRTLAITPDGPRGPRQKLQHGVITLAQRTGLPIVPLGAGCTRAWWPGSWDRFMVPKPFSTVRVQYGEPHPVPSDLSPEEHERHVRELEADMNALIDRLDGDGGPDR